MKEQIFPESFFERFRVRPWIVWATGLLAYIVAVLDRTTLGVSGLEAGDRFTASPGVLSSFVVLQIVVYAGAQVPAGLLLDRFGSKALILSGATLMAAGQLTGICGQLGQVLSAVPFLALLAARGWTAAYLSVVALGVISVALTLALVKNTPNGKVADPPS